MVLLGSLATFLVVGSTFLVGMFLTHNEIKEKSSLLSEYSSSYVQDIMEEQGKRELSVIVKSVTILIDGALQEISADTEYFSEGVTLELKSPTTGFSARNLPVVNDHQSVRSGETYIFYTPDLLKRGIDPALEQEIERAGNISKFFDPLGNRFRGYVASFMVASKNGYYICVETTADGSNIDFSEEFLTTYDFRERPWYKEGEQVKKPTFTDIFTDTEGTPSFACVAPYYDEHGNFAGVISCGYEVTELHKTVLNNTFGSDGFSFILNSSGNVILSTKAEGIFAVREGDHDLRKETEPTLAEAAKRMAAGETGVMSILVNGEEYFIAFAPMKASGWSFATLTSRASIMSPAVAAREGMLVQMNNFRNNMEKLFIDMFIAALVVFAALLVWVFIGSSRVAKRFVKPIQQLSKGVREISGGNLDKKVYLDTGDELEELAKSVNNMTDDLKNYMANLEKVTAAEERIATELKVATNIQLSALPHDFLEDHSEFEIYATMKPAKEVGGDFYDFYLLDENHLMITIADVSGKGVPAALFMMRGKTILKNLAMTMQSPDDLAAVMTLANDQLCQGNDEMMFITVFMGMLDLKTGRFIYVNGGHNPPMVYSENEKKFHYMKVEENCVLGLMDEMDFEQQEIHIDHKDILYLYTDGVTEAMSESREQYGEERLENCLNSIEHQCNLKVLLEDVSKSLAEHVQDAEQSDDITMLTVRFV